MEYLPLIGTVALLNLFAAISPGPDFLMTVKNSLKYSRRSGIYTGIGIGLGISVHIFYCAAGIGYIISKSVLIFTVIKFIGAAYLIYMGITSILAKKSKIEVTETKQLKDLTPGQSLRIGFITNVFNPKATLFFLGLFTFVINHNTPLHIVVIIAVIMVITAMVWFTVVSVFFTQKHIRNGFMKIETIMNKVFGGLLIILGIKIALASR